MGLNAARSVAARSLEVFQTGIEVAGQNIANANTPGYVREDLVLASGPTYGDGRLVKGTGANLVGVRQAIDKFLEERVYAANSDLAGSQIRQEAYLSLESSLAELGTGDLSTRMNELISSLNEYANEPTLPGLRELVISEGQTLANSINYTREQADRLRSNFNVQLDATVTEANSLLGRIQDLNTQIVRLEAAGIQQSDAGGLRSQRLVALDRLSEIVDIQTHELDNGHVDIRAGQEYLIIGQATQEFETYRPSESDQSVVGLGVRFSETKFSDIAGDGEFVGLIDARDDVLGGFTTQLDDFAAGFLFEFNRIHSAGSGETGYTSILSEHGVTDSTVALNETATNGLNFTASHGSFTIVVRDTETGSETTTDIAIDLDGLGGNDTSLDDLASALDAVSQLNASVDGDGKLRITTDAGYDVRFQGDTSGVLAALGVNTFFQGIDSETIQVSDVVRNDSTKFAGGRGGGPGDSSNALAMIELFEQPLETFGNRSIDAQYQTLVYTVAQGSSAEQTAASGFELFHDSLMSQREQTSGVSIDEETVNILQYQHSYQAAARVLTTVNELFDILIAL